MQLSVIILNYNVRFFLEQCVLSVQKALENIDGEIIVIDNNSSDDSCEMIKTLFPTIKLIENKENVGFPKGNNIGVAQAKGEYICILNPDTVVAENTFSKILDFVTLSAVEVRNSQLGILGCKLIDGTGNFLPESKRGVPTPWVAFTKIFGLYKVSNLFGKYYAQHLTENQSGKVDILVGAFMVMKRELYNEIGGFDENCFMYSDDIDLSYMALQKGKSNYYFHETNVIHYKGESTIRDEKYMKRFQEAMQFFYKKHFKKSVLFDFFMKIGAFVFSLVKKNQFKIVTKEIDEYIIFSKEELQLNLKNKTTILNEFSKFENNLNSNIEIIFDTKSFSFKEIIAFMNSNKSKNLTFKNYIPNSNYLIGSNNSIDRGEIIQLKN
ncbi:glycosyltransferase family 2 protein [Flavobacterium sp. SUN052]|uniref:glycosyltransferase family 2 protein n=1 Tax=Flavobacterium sp. SUN052 TaxID=3002441 RepID=UPI00237DFFD5|nr:glycosyltransferase family 2 protein [Flavobacterium sp. SUN052]MEC4003931.1 glycosyltransferase family 2 protein [Flavobacterium sp. SUN052]